MLYFVLMMLPLWLGCGIVAPEEEVRTDHKDHNPCFELDQMSCFDCLAEENPEVFQHYQDSILFSCFCGAECYSLCEGFCGDLESKEPECQECFDVVSQHPQSICIMDVLWECEQDDACLSFVLQIQHCSS